VCEKAFFSKLAKIGGVMFAMKCLTDKTKQKNTLAFLFFTFYYFLNLNLGFRAKM
jgi:hypothetical protein